MSRAVLFLLFVLARAAVNAQPPPAQLPLLVDDDGDKLTIQHNYQKPDELIRKNIFVKAEASKKTVYTGEPVLVTYKLYTALSSQARVSKQPAFNGCSILELSVSKEGNEENINGKKFHVFIIRKLQVTALQPGTLSLGEATVENVVQLPNAQQTSYENFSCTVSNAPLSIEVLPLPEIHKPLGFAGPVGNFTISARVDSNKVPVGENAVLHITIKGTGNVTGVRSPIVNWPQGTEHFDGSDTQHIDQDNYPVNGYTSFDIPFIGTAEENITIPPVQFSYFDATLKDYKTVSSDSIPVTFTKAITRSEQMNSVVTEDVTNRKYLWIVAAIAATVISVWLISSYTTNKKIQKEKIAASKKAATLVAPKITSPVISSAEIFASLHTLGEITTGKRFFVKNKTVSHHCFAK